MEPPIIFNLFPRLAGTLDRWLVHAERARMMGFNWLFLNPISQPGFSGSLYSVRDHDRLADVFRPRGLEGDGLSALAEVLTDFRALGLKPMMDLVINHTAIDCPLTDSHPDWFMRNPDGTVMHPSAIDPADARKVTVWGDLAEVDNGGSSDRAGLWSYWTELIAQSMDLGFLGFRCDAAYKVPAELWRELVSTARAKNPKVRFFAETLGCRLEEVAALQTAGLDYLFNSSKFWNLDAPWALEQHASFGAIAPSVSFPESHDTPRLMAESGGLDRVQRQRYLLAAVFSEGLLMPLGYEYGFSKAMNVVNSNPQDWEHTGLDLSAFIRSVNLLKLELGALKGEGSLKALSPFDGPTFILEKTCGKDQAFVLFNKDWHEPQILHLENLSGPAYARLIRISKDGQVSREDVPGQIELLPAEVALIA